MERMHRPVGPRAGLSGLRGKSAVRKAVLAGVVAAAGWAAVPAVATTYYWDPGQTNADPGSGGTGTWDLGQANWKQQGVAGDVVYPSLLASTNAAFSGAAGTAGLTTSLNALGLTFLTPGYSVTGTSTISIGTAGLNSAALAPGGMTSIGTKISLSAAQIWTAGAGNTLALGSTSGVGGSGTLVIAAGTVSYAGTAFNAGKFTVSGGGTFTTSGTGSVTAGTNFAIADGSAGTMNVTGGSFSSNQAVFVGKDSTYTGALNVSGGTFALTGGATSPGVPYALQLGTGANNNANGVGVVTVSGGTLGVNSTFPILLGNAGSGSGTLNLDGGTFQAKSAITRGTYATVTAGQTQGSVVNFNGGTLQATGTGLQIAAAVQINVRNGGAVIDTQANDVTLAAGLTHSALGGDSATDGGLTKKGSAILTLTGVNTYTGDTSVQGGALYLGGTNPAVTFGNGAGTISVADVASVGVNSPANVTIANVITGAGRVYQSGAGTTTLTGVNGYTGSTNIDAGTLAVPALSALGNTAGLNLGSNNVGSTLRYTGGVATLSTLITMGGLGTQSLDASGTGALTVSSIITSSNTGTRTLNLTGTSDPAVLNTLASAVNDNPNTGVVSLTKSGTNTWVLTGTNNYSGATTLSGGTLGLGGAQPLGGSGAVSSVPTISFVGGTLQFTAANQIDYSSRFSKAASQAFSIDTNGQTVTFATLLGSSGGTLTKLGAGTLILTGDGAASGYTGVTTIAAGTLQLGNGSTSGVVYQAAPAAIVDNATLALNRSGGFTLANPIGGTGTVSQIGAGSVQLSGVLSQAGGLSIGAGGATLSAANTYAGVTTVNGLVDIKTSNTALGATGPGNGTMVNAGGTLRVRDSANLSIAESIVLSGGGLVTYNAAATTTFSGAITLNAAATVQISPQAQGGTTTVFSGGFAEGAAGSGLTFVRSGAAGVASADVVVLTATSTYGGPTAVTDALSTNAGTFSVKLSGGNDRLPVTSVLTLGGTAGGGAADGSGRVVLGDATTGAVSQTLAGLATAGTGTKNAIIGGSAAISTLTLGVAGGTDTYAGLLGGAGTNENKLALTKSGNGTLVLSGSNTFAGGTSVAGGTLRVAAGGSLGPGLTRVTGGVLAGDGNTGGPVQVEVGGAITAGSGAALPSQSPGLTTDSVGTLATGPQTWTAGGAYRIKFAGGAFPVNDLLTMSTLNLAALSNASTATKFSLILIDTTAGAFDPAGGTYTIARTTGGPGSVTLPGGYTSDVTDLFNLDVSYVGLPSNTNYTLILGTTAAGRELKLVYSSVPEPTSVVLLGVGGATLLGRRRRRPTGGTPRRA